MTKQTFSIGDRVRYRHPDDYTNGWVFGTISHGPDLRVTHPGVYCPVWVTFDDGETVAESAEQLVLAEPCHVCHGEPYRGTFGTPIPCPECYGSGCKGAAAVPPYGDMGGPF